MHLRRQRGNARRKGAQKRREPVGPCEIQLRRHRKRPRQKNRHVWERGYFAANQRETNSLEKTFPLHHRGALRPLPSGKKTSDRRDESDMGGGNIFRAGERKPREKKRGFPLGKDQWSRGGIAKKSRSKKNPARKF